MGSIITELNSTTERNIELIEDRIARLERLIQEADRRVTVLRRDLSSQRGESPTYTRQGRHAGAGQSGQSRRAQEPDASQPAARAPHEQPHEQPPDGGPSGDQDAFVLSQDGTIREERGDSSGRPTARERVRALYLQGLSFERIASVVGKTVGEVELIVSLDEGTER